MPTLKKEYDKNTNTVSYVLSSESNTKLLLPSNDITTDAEPQSTPHTKPHKKEQRLATNALTECLPSDKKQNKQRDRDKHLKSFQQSLIRKYGSEKDKMFKEMRKKYLKQKLELSQEIMSYLDTIPKLNKLRHKFTENELGKLLLLQKALQISPKQYKKVLSRYPYILKLDIEKDVMPKMKGLQQIFPNQDTLSVFIRAPNIIATPTSTWLTRRDKINNLLGIRKDVFVHAITKQPSILFNSMIKTTGPKIRFLCDRVRSKYELQCILYTQPSILKVGWGRFARIEFLRSAAVPHVWQKEVVGPPPGNECNVLGDKCDDDLQDLNDADLGKKVDETTLNLRKLRQKEREMNVEWHLNRTSVTWNHRQMKYHYPKYVQFLEEFTLRAKREKMWTKSDLSNMTTKEMEDIVGEALRRKYMNRKVSGINWQKKELKQRQIKRLKRIRKKMSETAPIEKAKF